MLYSALTVAKIGSPPVRAKLQKQRAKAKPTKRVYRKTVPTPRARLDVCVDAGGGVDGAGAAAASEEDLRLEPRPLPDFALAPARVPGGAALAPPPRVIVTMTTLPARIDQIRPVLESLIAQSAPAAEIRIYCPRESWRERRAYSRPAFLDRMPSVRVVDIEVDYGPATKVIPAVVAALADGAPVDERDALLVVVDDDTLYPPRLLETLAAWSARLPDAVVSATGWPVTRNLRYPHWTENYLVYGNELYAPHPVSIIRGNCGFAVRARFFDEALWTTMAAAPPGATVMDDVWISGHLARRKIPRFVVPFDADQFTRAAQLENVITLDANLGTGVKDRKAANEAGLAHFRSDWDVFWDPPAQSVSFAGADIR